MSGFTALFVIFLYLVFLIAPISSVYKSSKKYGNKKKLIIRAFFLSFFVPFITMVFYLISGALDQYFPIIFIIAGAIWYFAVLPLVFWWGFVFSGKGFEHKQFILLALILTYIVGYILFLIANPIEGGISTQNDLKKLNGDYKQTIDYLNSYKQAYGFYPAVLSKDYVHAKLLTDYTYQTLNNQRDFKLSLGDYIYYCSNLTLQECIPQGSYKKIGDWVEIN